MSWLLEFVFGRIARALDGYKTIIGAVGLTLTAVAGIIGHFFPDTGIPAMSVESAMLVISGAWSVAGIGHKLEKVIQK